MAFENVFLRLGGGERDEGVCVVWKCPWCNAERDYHLIVTESKISVLSLSIGRSYTMLDLRCSKCDHEVRVEVSERHLLERAQQLTRTFRDGGLSPENYAAKIREIPAQFVRDLESLTDTWKCEKCGESNPTTFDTCWNCRQSTATPDLDGPSREISGLPPSGFPWEH